MPTKAEIEAQITATQTTLQTATNIIDTGGQLTANELRGLLQTQVSAIGSLLSLLNQNGYNLIDDVFTSSNLFTQNLQLQQNRSHRLNGHEFGISDDSDESFISSMSMSAPTTMFDVFEFGAGNLDANASIGISLGEVFFSARNENYRNRIVRLSPYNGIDIKNDGWVPLFRTGFSPAESVVEVEYRVSGNVYPLKQFYFKKETVILSWDSTNYQHVVWDDQPTYSQFEGRHSTTTPEGSLVTLKTRAVIDDSGYFAIEVSTPDYAINTIWHYEILIRTL